MADVRTGCVHAHHVLVALLPEEQWLEEREYQGAKDLLVTQVTASCEPNERPDCATLSGWYAKADGTASKTRCTWPKTVKLSDLPESARNLILTALHDARHG